MEEYTSYHQFQSNYSFFTGSKISFTPKKSYCILKYLNTKNKCFNYIARPNFDRYLIFLVK